MLLKYIFSQVLITILFHFLRLGPLDCLHCMRLDDLKHLISIKSLRVRFLFIPGLHGRELSSYRAVICLSRVSYIPSPLKERRKKKVLKMQATCVKTVSINKNSTFFSFVIKYSLNKFRYKI